MASSKEYLDFILDQLSDSGNVSYRAMMGEYIIYYRAGGRRDEVSPHRGRGEGRRA